MNEGMERVRRDHGSTAYADSTQLIRCNLGVEGRLAEAGSCHRLADRIGQLGGGCRVGLHMRTSSWVERVRLWPEARD